MSNAILMFFRQEVLVLLFPWLYSVLKIWRPLLVRLLLRVVSVPYYGLFSWKEYTRLLMNVNEQSRYEKYICRVSPHLSYNRRNI